MDWRFKLSLDDDSKLLIVAVRPVMACNGLIIGISMLLFTLYRLRLCRLMDDVLIRLMVSLDCIAGVEFDTADEL